jgi:hypothetical protein
MQLSGPDNRLDSVEELTDREEPVGIVGIPDTYVDQVIYR